METGTIVRRRDNGYGFIGIDGSPDIFFHASALVDIAFDDLREGDSVQFDTEVVPLGTTPREAVEKGEVFLPYDRHDIASSVSKHTLEIQKTLTAELIRRIVKSPSELYQLTPKQFEEVIADLYVVDGYSVELMGSWNQADGGVDILAIKAISESHNFRTAIQCKRYSAENRVAAAPIRELAGVLDRFQAHSGALITTSEFTGPAIREAVHYWRVDLIAFQGVIDKLRRAELLIDARANFTSRPTRPVAPIRMMRRAANVRRA